jgi:hypothetical protein
MTMLFALSSFVFVVFADEAKLPPRAGIKYAYDLVGGSCDEFNSHVRDRGLRDSEGNTHIGTLGFTSCSFNAPGQRQQVKVEQTKEKSNVVCASTDLSNINYTSAETITIMRWDYGNALISNECKTELSRMESAVKAHEAEHVSDCKTILDEAHKTWSEEKHIIKACAEPSKQFNHDDLVKKLNAKAQAEVSAHLSKMGREMEVRSRDTHERIGYGTTAINCSICRVSSPQ